MLQGQFLTALNSSGGAGGGGKKSSRGRAYLVALGVASIVALGLLLSGLGVFNQSTVTSTSRTTTNTSYNVDASSVIASAATYAPASGYTQGSSKQLNPKEAGLETAAYALFSNQGGALANMTILVFDTPASAQTYIDSVISNTKDLIGYSDLTSVLTNYQHYGTCYGYGESDPEGAGAIATGICTKGNVYIQVHLATTASLPSVEGDMSGLVGAAYQSIG
jgi:hypothetical protein